MTNSAYEIHNLLVLSTSHITAEDDELIAAAIYPGKGGDEVSLLVYCGAPDDESFVREIDGAARYSAAFVQAVKLARGLGCRYLLFDNAGPVTEGLPVFDW